MGLVKLINITNSLVLITALNSCADGDNGAGKRGLRAKADFSGDGTAENSSSANSRSYDQPESIAPADCEGQWKLILKQQPKGAVFQYQETAPKLSISATRVDTITSSSEQGVTRSIVVNNPIVNAFVSKPGGQAVTLTKDLFLRGCSKNNGQPISEMVLGGTVQFSAPTSESISINGTSIAAKKFVGTASNFKYGSLTVNADVVIFTSPLYPAIPLKQVMVFKSESPLLNGVEITDELISKLP
jgi:hypothetical protein